jgi:hypothetical protein
MRMTRPILLLETLNKLATLTEKNSAPTAENNTLKARQKNSPGIRAIG